jgi:hypothetical protein
MNLILISFDEKFSLYRELVKIISAWFYDDIWRIFPEKEDWFITI